MLCESIWIKAATPCFISCWETGGDGKPAASWPGPLKKLKPCYGWEGFAQHCSVMCHQKKTLFFKACIFLFTSIITSENKGIWEIRNPHRSHYILFLHDSHAKSRMTRTTMDSCFSVLLFFFWWKFCLGRKKKKAICPRFSSMSQTHTTGAEWLMHRYFCSGNPVKKYGTNLFILIFKTRHSE